MNYKEWNKIGYNQEELYFEKINRELIHRLKSQKMTVIRYNPESVKMIHFHTKVMKKEGILFNKAA